MTTIAKGLEGIVAAETKLSKVDGLAGKLTIGGYPVEVLAPNATFEEVLHLLWNGHLPNAEQLADLQQKLNGYRPLPEATIALLREAAAANVHPMNALLMGCATLSIHDPDPAEQSFSGNLKRAMLLVASFPGIVAAFWRLKAGQEPLSPQPELGHAANFLYMLTGEAPNAALARGLETYLNTVIDHGLNASTFAARVIISTESDIISAVTGAIGALKGPLHGGAPGPALDMVFEIGHPENAEAYIKEKLARKEKIMGFGHRVYKVRDPRADVLAEAADRLFDMAGDRAVYNLAKSVEATTLQVFKELKPNHQIQTNVEFYTALLLHGVGLKPDIFSSMFAISRVGGWTAHVLEQLQANRIIRPSSVYTGDENRQWVPIAQRS